MSDTGHEAAQAGGRGRKLGIWLAGLAGLVLGAGAAGVERWVGHEAVISAARAEVAATEVVAGRQDAELARRADGALAAQSRETKNAATQQAAAIAPTEVVAPPDYWHLALAKALEGARPAVAKAWSTDGAAVFVDAAGLTAAGDAVLAALTDARARGLRDPSARSDELRQQAAALPTAGTEVAKAEARAALEVAVALEAEALAADLMARPRADVVLKDERGRYLSPDVLTAEPPPPLDDAAVVAMREAAGRGAEGFNAWLGALLPATEQYQRLVEAARRYEGLCAAGGFGEVSALSPGKKNEGRGDAAQAALALQKRLAVEGYLAGEPSGTMDDATREALTRYQANHQLDETGTLDAPTIEALNVPCETRLRTLRHNAQRWRTTARQAEATFVEVNLAAQRVRFVADGVEKMAQRAVVGSGRWYWNSDAKRRVYATASPILHDEINQVVVNPSWTVPASIVRQEFQKKIDKDPEWLAKKGYEVVVSKGGLRTIVEPPGPRNTLGDVKMLFPNSESVYLHDTNQRRFFAKARRDLSHGCIRVHNALDFATELLTWEASQRGETWPDRKVHSLAVYNTTYWFKLEKFIPVFVEYYTASVGDDGVVSFHWDIYDYDRVFFEGPLGPK
jgi:murein L,D-transpeptidase YcbB/YkuD